jgi:hypothetical protein
MSSSTQRTRSISGNKKSDAQAKDNSVAQTLAKKSAMRTESHSQDADRHRKVVHLKSGK